LKCWSEMTVHEVIDDDDEFVGKKPSETAIMILYSMMTGMA
jgi:hypothetical protein